MTEGMTRSGWGGLLVGLLLLATGAIMFLHAQDIYHLGNVWRLWPIFMIIFGINSLLQCGRRKVFSGLLMIGMGILFLLINFHVAGLRMRHFAPLVVLITGISFIADALWSRFGTNDETTTGGAS